jgi:uncharacterized protein (DUF885 family)
LSTNVVHDLADELLGLQSTFNPLNATMVGVPGYAARMADPSPAADEALRAGAERIAARASAMDRTAVCEDDAITLSVVIQQAHALINRIDAGMVEYTVADSQFVGPAATMLTYMSMTALSSRTDADAYLDRLRAVPAYLEAVLGRHRLGAAAGRVPVRRLVDATVSHLDRYLGDPHGDPLLRPAPPEDGHGFGERRAHLVENVVRPALARYRAGLVEDIAEHARPDERPGLCWLPGGDSAYTALAWVQTTIDRTPDALHRLGLDIIADLRQEYADLGARVFGTKDPADVFDRLVTDPAMRWSNGGELLAHARAAIERAEAALPAWFGEFAVHRCQVQPVPAADAPGAPPGYYFQPSLDGHRPGVYYANTFQAYRRDRFLSEVIAFHEAVPGHHLQLTMAVSRTALPLLRRFADINASLEGWALYTERLADEMGLYSDDVARLGMLAMDSLRGARLVVDTGIHAKGWTRDQAIAYMRLNTPLSPVVIQQEVDRYIAMPAQALSYMTGRLEIQRIRAAAKQRLGPRFDIRAFHDLILGSAPLPLGVLDELMTRWDGSRPPEAVGGIGNHNDD